MNLFDKAKKKAPKTKKVAEQKREVIINGFDSQFDEIIDLQKEIATKSAKIKTIHKAILDQGKEEYISLYEKENKNPGSFNLVSDNGSSVMVVPMERYPSIDEPTKELIEEHYGEDVVEEKTTFSFNGALLNRYFDEISDLIMKSKKISKEDKEALIEATTKRSIKKGTIDSLHTLGEGNVQDNWDTLQPSMQLKGFSKKEDK